MSRLGARTRKNRWKAPVPRHDWTPQIPLREKQDHEDSAMLSSEVGVLLVSKVVESADKQHRIELLGKEDRRQDDSHCCHLIRFHDTGTRRHVPSSDLTRQ